MSGRNVRCNLTEEERGRVLTYFDEWLTDEEEAVFSARFPQYIFYQSYRRGQQRRCVCTGCGEFTTDKAKEPAFFLVKHKQRTRCPACGQEATLYAMGRVQTGSTLVKWEAAAFMRQAPDGGLLLLAGWGIKRYSPEDLMPCVDFYVRKIAYFNKGKRCMWEMAPIYRDCNGEWLPEGKYLLVEKASVHEPFAKGLFHSDGWYYLFGFENLKKTALKYCEIELFYAMWRGQYAEVWLSNEDNRVEGIFSYLAWYTEHPLMEMAVKLGMIDAVGELVVRGVKNHRDLNWKANSLAGFLRLKKPDAKEFAKKHFNLAQLRELHRGMKCGQYKSTAHFAGLLRDFGSLKNMERGRQCAELGGLKLEKAAWYLKRLADQGIFRREDKRGALQHWKDYLEAAIELGYDLGNATVVMPLDLRQRHDTATSMVKAKVSEKAVRKYAERKEKLEKLYRFRYGGFEIVIPEGMEDIVREGRILKHCVGGYAQRHMEGKLDILFFRHIKKPGRPFMTIEMQARKSASSPVKLIQIHGYRNEAYLTWEERRNPKTDPEQKYKWFLDAWFSWMNAGSKRDKNGQPVIPAERQERA